MIVLLIKPSVNVRLSSLIRAVRIPKHKPLFFTAFFFSNVAAKKMSISLLNESVPAPLESDRVGGRVGKIGRQETFQETMLHELP